MSIITWSNNPEDDGTHDLCGRSDGVFVDVIWSLSGWWHVSYNNITFANKFESRDDAKDWAESTDLIAEVLIK